MMRGDRTILVAEDEPEVRHYLEMALRCQGYGVECAENGEEVLHCLSDSRRRISLLLLDLMMPRKDGMETLRDIRRIDRDLPIIILSAASAPLHVVEAMKCGANDFLGKPVTHDELDRAIRKALNLEAPPARRPDAGPAAPELELYLWSNERMKAIEAALKQVAASDVPVLIQGESGVGKEVVARRIHTLSSRAGKPLLKLNCAAMPSELLESELFGYERGAFTGALKDKPGKFELADGGTILLDEIGDMDVKLQAKLLHVLQDHQFQRLGGKDNVKVNVRVLAATHSDLDAAIREGRFREDLYYRINVINIHVPPLRERRDEILPLANLFLRKHGLLGAPAPQITPELERALLDHDWPGNIRELENVMRKFLVFRDPGSLAEELRSRTRRAAPPATPAFPRPPEPLRSLAVPPLAPAPSPGGVALDPEAAEVLKALEAARWNRRRAARLLNMDYRALLYKTKKLGIAPKRIGRPAPPPSPSFAGPAPLTLEHVSLINRQAEAEAILSALEKTRWNRRQAAALLGVDYKVLLYRMKKLSIGEPELAN